jgi:hypothetical protein
VDEPKTMNMNDDPPSREGFPEKATTTPSSKEQMEKYLLESIEQLAPEDSEPYRVRSLAENKCGSVVTDGAFFSLIKRLEARDMIRLLKRRRSVNAGSTPRLEVFGAYELTNAGHRRLSELNNPAQQPETNWLHQAVRRSMLLPGLIKG